MDIKSRIAKLLSGGNTFGGNTYGGQTFGGATYGGNQFGASAQPPTPQAMALKAPPLPPFQIPGMNTLAGGNFDRLHPGAAQNMPGAVVNMAPQQPAAAPTLPPMPAPQAVSMPPGMQQPQAGTLDPSVMPSTSSIDNRLAPAGNQLDQWRQALDAYQFARQGQ